MNDITIRTELRAGDLGAIVRWHGLLYDDEYGYDITFEAYVAGPLAQFVLNQTDRDRIWIAERGAHMVGCIAIVAASENEAQLRWFLVDPSARGHGLGRRLLHDAIEFARSCRFKSIFLWTESQLLAAAHLYRDAGFRKTTEKPGAWGIRVIEEKYVLDL